MRRWLDASPSSRRTIANCAAMTVGFRSGIIFINRDGLRLSDASKEHGPPKTIYISWKRWNDEGIFARIMAGLAFEAAVLKAVVNRLAKLALTHF